PTPAGCGFSSARRGYRSTWYPSISVRRNSSLRPIAPSTRVRSSQPSYSMMAPRSARCLRSCGISTTPKDKAVITMWERRVELEGFAPVMEGVRNAAERLKGRAIAGPHDYEQIPGLVARSRQRVANFYDDFEARLNEVAFVAGDRFS